MMWRPVHKFGLFPFHRNVKYESEAPSQCAGLRSAPDLKPLDHVDVKCEALPEMVGHSAVQGWRLSMEDRYIMSDLDLSQHSLLAIFDGHSGVGAANYCSANLVETLQHTASWQSYKEAYRRGPPATSTVGNSEVSAKKRRLLQKSKDTVLDAQREHYAVLNGLLSKALVESFIALDSEFLQSLVTEISDTLSNAKEPGFSTNQSRKRSSSGDLSEHPSVPPPIANLLRQNVNGGCTAVCALLTPSHVIVASCGDSRCIISGCKQVDDNADGSGPSLQYTTVSMTEDHKPSLEDESIRISAAGGFVADDRVDGELAMSRAIGDYRYKLNPSLSMLEQKVICVPDIAIYERTSRKMPTVGSEVDTSDLIILACDGIAEVIDDNVEVVRIARELVNTEIARKGFAGIRYSNISRKLIQHAIKMNSTDNISVITAPLHSAASNGIAHGGK